MEKYKKIYMEITFLENNKNQLKENSIVNW
jgi:hypothetical protein